jgi:mono/diheme cytochrome c family protein
MQFPMPSYKGVLSEQEIRNILTYIRLWWTAPQRAHQQAVTRRWADIQQQFAVETTEEPALAPSPTPAGS